MADKNTYYKLRKRAFDLGLRQSYEVLNSGKDYALVRTDSIQPEGARATAFGEAFTMTPVMDAVMEADILLYRTLGLDGAVPSERFMELVNHDKMSNAANKPLTDPSKQQAAAYEKNDYSKQQAASYEKNSLGNEMRMKQNPPGMNIPQSQNSPYSVKSDKNVKSNTNNTNASTNANVNANTNANVNYGNNDNSKNTGNARSMSNPNNVSSKSNRGNTDNLYNANGITANNTAAAPPSNGTSSAASMAWRQHLRGTAKDAAKEETAPRQDTIAAQADIPAGKNIGLGNNANTGNTGYQGQAGKQSPWSSQGYADTKKQSQAPTAGSTANPIQETAGMPDTVDGKADKQAGAETSTDAKPQDAKQAVNTNNEHNENGGGFANLMSGLFRGKRNEPKEPKQDRKAGSKQDAAAEKTADKAESPNKSVENEMFDDSLIIIEGTPLDSPDRKANEASKEKTNGTSDKQGGTAANTSAQSSDKDSKDVKDNEGQETGNVKKRPVVAINKPQAAKTAQPVQEAPAADDNFKVTIGKYKYQPQNTIEEILKNDKQFIRNIISIERPNMEYRKCIEKIKAYMEAHNISLDA